MEKSILKVYLAWSFFFLMAIIETFYLVITVIRCIGCYPKKVLHIDKSLLISRIVLHIDKSLLIKRIGIILYCIISFVYFSDDTIDDSSIRLIIRNIEIPLIIFLQFLEIPIGMINFVSSKCIMTEGRLFINNEKTSYKICERVNEFYSIEIFIKGCLYKRVICNEEMFWIIKKHYATINID